MIFENIFKFATDLAGAGATSESTLAKLLPTTPSEKSAVPQHDPSQPAPPADEPQDPRLVRDTMPHLSAIGDYVAAVTGAMATAPSKQEDLVTDPSQTTGAAQSIVKAGQDAVKQFGTSATKPSPEPSAPPTTTAPATPEPPANS